MFEQREAAYEAKWAHDQNTLFRVTARRDRLVGLWAAQKLGLSGPAADAYVESVARAGFSKLPHATIDKIRADLRAANITISDASFTDRMKDLLVQAWSEITLED